MSGTTVITRLLLNIPWPEILASIWKYGHKILRGLSHEGMYEVLEYEAVLELLDRDGRKARFKKRKKVRYLQDNIIAYQDYAWGDGELFNSYRCAPSTVQKPHPKYFTLEKRWLFGNLREKATYGGQAKSL